jgi:MATE family multidrug resistance protein
MFGHWCYNAPVSFREYEIEFGRLFRLAVPLAVVQAGQTLMGVVDLAVVGRLGAAEIGAVGLGNALFFFFAMFASGVVMGIDPLVSQAVGAGNPIRARKMLWQGVYLSFAIGILVMIPLSFSPAILPLFKIDPEVVGLATTYTTIRAITLIPLLLYVVVRSYLQGKSITRPMVLSMLIGNVFNLGADLLLVYGGGGWPVWTGPLREIPALGVTGAAIATVLSAFLQLAIVAIALPAVRLPDTSTEKLYTFLPDDCRRALHVGLPLGFQLAAEVGIFALVGFFAGSIGELALASHQVALTLASFTFTVAVGIGSAASVRVGVGVGSRNQRAARVAGMTAFLFGAGYMSLMAVAFALFPEKVATLLTNKPEVIAAAAPVLIVAAFFQISDGIQAVGAGVLRGAGDTRFAFAANVVGHWLVGMPIALWLGFGAGYGVIGLWWGLCAGLSAVALLLFLRFRRISSRAIRPLAPT